MKSIITLFITISFSISQQYAAGQSLRADKDTSKINRMSSLLGIETVKIKRLLLSLQANQLAIDSVLRNKTLGHSAKHEMFLKLKKDREDITSSMLTPTEFDKFNQMAKTIATDRNNGLRTRAEAGIKLKPLKDSVKIKQPTKKNN